MKLTPNEEQECIALKNIQVTMDIIMDKIEHNFKAFHDADLKQAVKLNKELESLYLQLERARAKWDMEIAKLLIEQKGGE